MSSARVTSTTLFGSRNALVLSDALKLVERVASGSIGLVYIDPPLFPKASDSATSTQCESMRSHLLSLSGVFQQVRRCLTEAGNLFVHSEPEMNGSIRLLLDQIFGRDNFRQEIIVPRVTVARSRPVSGHDTVFHFSVGPNSIFNPQTRPLSQEEVITQFRASDNRGPYRLASLTSQVSRHSLRFEWQGFRLSPGVSWRYTRERLDSLLQEGRIEMPASGGKLPRLKQYISEHTGVDVGTIWDDLPRRLSSIEALGYPTQKQESVIERIIRMGSREGETVLDPFCGSGTTLAVAQKSGRRWVGGDNNSVAIDMTIQRLELECGLERERDYIAIDEEQLLEAGPVHIPSLRVATGFDDLVSDSVPRFVFGEPLKIEETREYEFKEVTSIKPYDAIANTADEYAVAFLNSEGGRIFWGVRDRDRVVVGVQLDGQDRDRLRRTVTNKLGAIRPAIDPTLYRLDIHPVSHPSGGKDLFVVELVIPQVRNTQPYFTCGNESFIRLDGVKRKLAGPELTEWIIRRISNA
jgi:hypothetical protein